MEQIGSVPVPQTGQPLQVGGAVLLAPGAAAAFLLEVVDQQAVGQVGGQEEGRVGRVEGPVGSDQARQRGSVGVTEQLQAVAVEGVQIRKLEESLEGVTNQRLEISLISYR